MSGTGASMRASRCWRASRARFSSRWPIGSAAARGTGCLGGPSAGTDSAEACDRVRRRLEWAPRARGLGQAIGDQQQDGRVVPEPRVAAPHLDALPPVAGSIPCSSATAPPPSLRGVDGRGGHGKWGRRSSGLAAEGGDSLMWQRPEGRRNSGSRCSPRLVAGEPERRPERDDLADDVRLHCGDLPCVDPAEAPPDERDPPAVLAARAPPSGPASHRGSARSARGSCPAASRARSTRGHGGTSASAGSTGHWP